MKLSTLIIITGLALLPLELLPGCASTGGSSATASAITADITAAVNDALPIAAQLGSAAAQAYVSGLVSDGKISNAEAGAINSAIASEAAVITTNADASGKALKSAWLDPATTAAVIAQAQAKLGIK